MTDPHAAHAHDHHQNGAAAPSTGAKDPVCGMSVDPANAKHSAQYEGRSYFFCSA